MRPAVARDESAPNGRKNKVSDRLSERASELVGGVTSAAGTSGVGNGWFCTNFGRVCVVFVEVRGERGER